jgi:hypothetical protein
MDEAKAFCCCLLFLAFEAPHTPQAGGLKCIILGVREGDELSSSSILHCKKRFTVSLPQPEIIPGQGEFG